MKQKVYARRFLRISPDMPLYGSARIVSIGNRRVNTGIAIVRILNISSGGLRFVSNLRMPIDHTVVLQINLRLDKTTYCIQGYIVHSRKNEVCDYEYGFRFLEPNEGLREALIRLFVRMSYKLQRHIIVLRLK